MSTNLANLLYLITIVTFILALRYLSDPARARRGNQIGAVGMVLAIVVTWVKIGTTSWWALALGMLLGGGFGAVAARKVKMTAMPQMVALFNGVGGGAAALIALGELHRILPAPGTPTLDISGAVALSGLIGSISFAGSMVAFAKLQELIQGRPITYPGQKVGNLVLLAACVGLGIALVAGVQDQWLLWAVVSGGALFGVLFVLPIGGADMPVVISLLNAFTGLAVAVGGFELENNVLIVSGMLVGASGTLLTMKMGQAMNRSIANVLFGAFGQVSAGAAAAAAGDGGGTVRSVSAEDVAVMLAYAHKVVFVPGYGLAVAQAQHDVRQLADRRAQQRRESDLWHADPRRRQRADRRRAEALDEPRFRGNRESAVLQPEDGHALRRREAVRREAHPGRQDTLTAMRCCRIACPYACQLCADMFVSAL